MADAAPDARVQAALSHWAPRMLSNGIDYNDFMATLARVQSWGAWSAEWSRTAARHEAIAARAADDGHLLTAGEAWVRASLCHHFGKFVFFDDLAQYEVAHQGTVENYRRAAPHLTPTAEAVAIPYRGGVLHGYLRKPAGAARPGIVQIIPGLDSVKEEFGNFEPVFLARGLATLTVDGPGQGEAEDRAIEPHYEHVVAACIEAMAARGDVDAGRYGAVGISLGGYYVARAAAFEPRLKAAVSVGGPYDMGAIFDSAPVLTQQALQARFRVDSVEAAREATRALSLDGVAERIRQPFFIVFGRQDRLIPFAQSERLAGEIASADKRFDLHADGNHVCNNIPYAWRPQVGDWLAERLRG
jgi:dipeptidyl aminopeptidase/acylaminoacyl peptidase